MRNVFIIPLLFLLSCNEEKKDTPKTDSAPVKDTSGLVTTVTDSGKSVISVVHGKMNGEALFYNTDGSLRQKGLYVDGLPSGAWITYDKTGNILTAEQFSRGKKLFDLDIADFDFILIAREEFGAGFVIPKKWKELSSPNPKLVLSWEKENVDSNIRLKPGINVARASLQKGETLESLANTQWNLLMNEYNGHAREISKILLTIDSCPAFMRYGRFPVTNDEVGFLNAIIISGNQVYLFSCNAQNSANMEFLKYQEVFEEVVKSFHRMK